MIDGVDVAECFHFDKDDYANKNTSYCMCDGNMSDICQENPNCYYKQLKQKEEECEMLKCGLGLSNSYVNKYFQALQEIKEFVENEMEQDVNTNIILQKCEVIDV